MPKETAAARPDAEEPEDNVIPIDEEEVDVDLDALDEDLRAEAVGNSTTVRIDGKVIHIIHAGDWSSAAMRAATNGDWEAWAQEVIMDPDEFNVWLDANLKNYQIEAVFDQCGRRARLNMGKSRKRSRSQRATRRR
jgi:hypothetical protein